MNSQKSFLLLLIVLLAAVGFMMIWPLLGYFLGAIILGFVMHPMQKRLRKVIGDRFSAFVLVLLGVVMVVLPIMFIGAAVLDDASDLAKDINQTEIVNNTRIEKQIKDYTGREFDIESNTNSVLRKFTQVTLGGFSQIVTVAAEITVGIMLLVFLLYYFLKDGEKLIWWLQEVAPLPPEIQDQLYSNINSTTWAVIKGHVIVAVVQGLVAGLGLVITGVPNYAFWTFIMVLLGFIPIVGTILVWLPASAYLFVSGRPAAGIFLFVYGMVIVGLTDNILRPLAVDRGSNLHPAVIIIGVIGGVYLFGAAGLFIGPIMLGILKSVLLVFENHYEDL